MMIPLAIVLGLECAFLVVGMTARSFGRHSMADWLSANAVAASLSVSLVPVIVLWLPFVHWTSLTVRIGAAALVAAWGILQVRRKKIRTSSRRSVRQPLLWAVLIVVIAISSCQVSKSDVPPGIDSVHHIMLTRLIADRGEIPWRLDPYIQEGRLVYHWGAHAGVAMLALLSGWSSAFDVASLLAAYGALLTILCSLGMYVAGRTLFGDARAGVIAAALTSGVSALPAALVQQGRFTQLAGVAILPSLLAFGARDRNTLTASLGRGVLIAGLFMVQVRVAIFAVTWIAVDALFHLRQPRNLIRKSVAPLLIAFLLVAPWVARLIREPLAQSMFRGESFAQHENSWTQRFVPEPMIWLPNNGLLLSAATGGLTGIAGLGVSGEVRFASAVWLLTVLSAALIYARGRRNRPNRASRRRASRERRIPIRNPPWRTFGRLFAWIVLSATVLLVHAREFDLTNIVPYAAGALTMFVPVILVASGLIAWVARILLPKSRSIIVVLVVLSCALSAAALASRRAARSPVPSADAAAIRWLTENVAPNARFIGMCHPFNGIFVGEDAGYWIQVLSDRRSLPPPMIYGWVSPPAQVARTNSLLQMWTTTPPESSVPQLMREGITHAFIGSAAHPETRAIMRNSRRFRIIYDRNDVLIAQLQ
jgi:hypothetical protein